MFIEITTGSDSFRASKNGLCPARNCKVLAFTRYKDRIMPLFAAVKDKVPGYASQKIVENIPGSQMFAAHGMGGNWYRNRFELMPGTEILVEYMHKVPGGAFQSSTERMFLICDASAPLFNIRLDLPPHELSSVPNVFFEGRFVIPNEKQHKVITKEAHALWCAHVGLDEPGACITDIVDTNEQHPHFHYDQLDGPLTNVAAKVETTLETVGENGSRRSRVVVRRGRKITI
ncbi:hypothetical protein RCMENCHIE_63 [Rhodobacter phage RcMenchie]|nr:hypothetical protein RCMENCHIE_63 [Rhodobacter phage RcMenchie]